MTLETADRQIGTALSRGKHEILLATKADVKEETDRLHAHIASARLLLKEKGSVGRKLDFLTQEFNRETNTLCSKSSDITSCARKALLAVN